MKGLPRESTRATQTALAAALEYAAQGWQLVLCWPLTKRPIQRHGVNDATSDPALITALLTRWPRANLAVRTGDGVAVLDIDPGGTLPDGFPPTLTVATPRGGEHRYYAVSEPVPNSVGRLAEHVDVRGEGGYVLVPPSATKAGSYAWQEPRLAIAQLPAARFLPAQRRATDASGTGERFTAREHVGSGGRNDYLARYAGWLYASGCTEHEVDTYLLAENAEVCHPPLKRYEVEQIAASIARYHA